MLSHVPVMLTLQLFLAWGIMSFSLSPHLFMLATKVLIFSRVWYHACAYCNACVYAASNAVHRHCSYHWLCQQCHYHKQFPASAKDAYAIQ